MPDDVASIHEKLGALLAETAAQRTDINRLIETSREDRQGLHEGINRLGRRVAVMDKELSTIEKQLREDVMPTVGKVKAWENRGVGALAAAGMVGAGIAAIVTAAISGTLGNVLHFLQRL